VLINLAAILAVGAFRVGWMQTMGANRVLNVELAHVGMDDSRNPDRSAVSDAQAVDDRRVDPGTPSPSQNRT
jgi:hypothetical protein